MRRLTGAGGAAFDSRSAGVVAWIGVASHGGGAGFHGNIMNFIHIVLQIIQIVLAVVLIIIVTGQTDKDQGMGGAFGGGADAGGSKYTGGFEEKMDNLAKNLSYSFLIVSVLVAFIGHRFL